MNDLAAIVIIALFYTAQLHLACLAAAGGVIVALLIINRLKVMALWPYLIGGLILCWSRASTPPWRAWPWRC